MANIRHSGKCFIRGCFVSIFARYPDDQDGVLTSSYNLDFFLAMFCSALPSISNRVCGYLFENSATFLVFVIFVFFRITMYAT